LPLKSLFKHGVRNICKWLRSTRYTSCITLTLLAYTGFSDVSEVKVDKDHGFFSSAFTVKLSTETADADIQYTLDGSDPRTSKTVQSAPSPVSVAIDPELTDGRTRTPAVVLRAVAVKQPDTPSAVLTKTYIFTAQVETQTYPGAPWPPQKATSGRDWITSQVYDYDMDSSVVNDPRYKGLIDDALMQIPSMSLAADMDSLFDSTAGIYANALNSGSEWERPGSLELINPDGSAGFSVPCGVRIRGGWSRHPDCPKHAFRLYFRSEYGAGKLDYPLFGNEGTTKFDKMCLRTAQNYSWSYYDDEGAHQTMIKDVFCRDAQRDMGHFYTRSRYYHLYINGMYWGIYQTQEQADSRFAESYMGGDYPDYDVMNTINDYTAGSDRDKTVEVDDGNADAAARLWAKTLDGFGSSSDYYGVQGLEEDGKTISTTSERLLDVDNLIDYMLITFYTGNFDSPTYAFSDPQRSNNFQAIYNRVKPDGFKWMCHDGEHTMVDFNVEMGKPVIPALDVDRTGPFELSDEIRFFNPQRIHQALCENSDYRMRFADHVFRTFFNEGVFCPEQSINRYRSRQIQIDTAIIAESARWGDSKAKTARTKDDDWLPELDRIYSEYMPLRPAIVVGQLKEDNLYPSIDPPVFSSGEPVISRKIAAAGTYHLTISNPNSNGEILYTTDGSDPRTPGGSISDAAQKSENALELSITATTMIKARIKTESEWSALRDMLIVMPQDFGGIKITEIHYKPLSNGDVTGEQYEFIELKNTGTAPINLSGVTIGGGVSYTIASGTSVMPGCFFVIAANRAAFTERYGFGPDGEFSNNLSNSGETLTLLDPAGALLYSVTYSDDAPWPSEPDKTGRSLVPKIAGASQDQNNGGNWIASSQVHGSPRCDDAGSEGAPVKQPRNGFKAQSTCRIGKFIVTVPFKNEFEVHILDMLGRTTKTFPEKSRQTYNWVPKTNGLYFIMLKSVSGEMVVRRVQVAE